VDGFASRDGTLAGILAGMEDEIVRLGSLVVGRKLAVRREVSVSEEGVSRLGLEVRMAKEGVGVVQGGGRFPAEVVGDDNGDHLSAEENEIDSFVVVVVDNMLVVEENNVDGAENDPPNGVA
jgi:hypothetical protein